VCRRIRIRLTNCWCIRLRGAFCAPYPVRPHEIQPSDTQPIGLVARARGNTSNKCSAAILRIQVTCRSFQRICDFGPWYSIGAFCRLGGKPSKIAQVQCTSGNRISCLGRVFVPRHGIPARLYLGSSMYLVKITCCHPNIDSKSCAKAQRKPRAA
jgi:hypothetical protein